MHRWVSAILSAGVLAVSALWAPPAWAGAGGFIQQIHDCVCINGAPIPNCDLISFHFKLLDENNSLAGGSGNFCLGEGKGGGLLNGDQGITTNANVSNNDSDSCFFLLTVCPASIELNGAPVAVSNFCAGELQFQANGGGSPVPLTFTGVSEFGGVALHDFHFTVDDPINVNIAPQAQGAPEIDAGAMAAPAALFIGGLLVLSDRRRRTP